MQWQKPLSTTKPNHVLSVDLYGACGWGKGEGRILCVNFVCRLYFIVSLQFFTLSFGKKLWVFCCAAQWTVYFFFIWYNNFSSAMECFSVAESHHSHRTHMRELQVMKIHLNSHYRLLNGLGKLFCCPERARMLWVNFWQSVNRYDSLYMRCVVNEAIMHCEKLQVLLVFVCDWRSVWWKLFIFEESFLFHCVINIIHSTLMNGLSLLYQSWKGPTLELKIVL